METQCPQLAENFILKDTYQIIKKIDQGAFGKIYQAIKIANDNQKDSKYAVKMQSVSSQVPQLVYECRIYNYLYFDKNAFNRGIPNVYMCGVVGDYNYLVMDLMGPSLQTLFSKCGRKFTLKTVLLLFDQMIRRLQYLHQRMIIHRDIKPDNFCMGRKEHSHKVFMLDFGLAKRYKTKEGFHIPFREGKSLTGTARYASLNTHLGRQQSRRDDLQGLIFVCLYFLKGTLPWMGLRGDTKQQKYDRIKTKKIQTKIQQLCKGCPIQFSKYLKDVRKLQFQQAPDYKCLRGPFLKLFQRMGYTRDSVYDWHYLPEYQKDNK